MKDELIVSEEVGLTTSMVQPGEIMRIIKHVHAIIKDAMIEGIDNDYAVIPGTKKKTLLKPGAEKLLMAFGLKGVPKSPQIVDLPDNHREVTVETEIIHMKSGQILTVGLGSCSTMEGKYRYRNADLVCPECGQATIIKGKTEFGGGWICYEKKGGCKKKWTDEDNPFSGVTAAKVEHDNPADYYNTVLKMASKRSMVDGAIRTTASSAMFTQDAEDMPEVLPPVDKKQPIQPPQSKGETREKINDDGSLVVVATIEEISQKSGISKDKKTGKDKPWTLHGIKADGIWYNTFDKKIANDAQAVKGRKVELQYIQGPKSKDLEKITLLDEPEPPKESLFDTPRDIPTDCTKDPNTCEHSSFDSDGKIFCVEGKQCQHQPTG